MDAIRGFRGVYHFLSNFHPAVVHYDGMEFQTVEAAYQAAKTLDLAFREEIRTAGTPGKAKVLGRRATLRPDWDRLKLSIMESLLLEKFKHAHLRELLVATHPLHLEESNSWHDTYWGTVNGEGENHLGRILMKIREKLRES